MSGRNMLTFMHANACLGIFKNFDIRGGGVPFADPVQRAAWTL